MESLLSVLLLMLFGGLLTYLSQFFFKRTVPFRDNTMRWIKTEDGDYINADQINYLYLSLHGPDDKATVLANLNNQEECDVIVAHVNSKKEGARILRIVVEWACKKGKLMDVAKEKKK